MLCVINGDKDFGNYDMFCTRMDKILSQSTNITIIVPQIYGQGTEMLAKLYALERGYNLEPVNAQGLYEKNHEFFYAFFHDLLHNLQIRAEKTEDKIGIVIFGDQVNDGMMCNAAQALDLKYKFIYPLD